MDKNLGVRLSEILKHSLLTKEELKLIFDYFIEKKEEESKEIIDRYEQERKSPCGLKMNINKLIILAGKLKKKLPTICSCDKK